MNKKILFICDHSMDLVGGSQESMKVVLDGLKNEYDISLVTPGTGKYLDRRIRHFHYSKYDSMKTMIKNPIAFLNYFISVLKLITDEKFSVIHTQEQVGYFVITLLKRFGLVPKQTIIVHTERGLMEKYNKFIRKIFYLSLKYTNVFITTTEYNHSAWTETIKNKLQYKNVKCILVENTAGQRFETYDYSKREIHDDYITVGFAGRYCSWKGWDRVVEICEKIKDFDNIGIEIVLGCLTDSDMRLGKELEEHISKILGNRFLCHFNYKIEEMDEFYYGIDVFIITSDPHSESFGRVLVEAMSRHVAILGTDCGGATEVMGDKKRICHSVDEIVEKILVLCRNRDFLKKEQEDCYERYIDNYSVYNNVSKHRELYSQIFNSIND